MQHKIRRYDVNCWLIMYVERWHTELASRSEKIHFLTNYLKADDLCLEWEIYTLCTEYPHTNKHTHTHTDIYKQWRVWEGCVCDILTMWVYTILVIVIPPSVLSFVHDIMTIICTQKYIIKDYFELLKPT